MHVAGVPSSPHWSRHVITSFFRSKTRGHLEDCLRTFLNGGKCRGLHHHVLTAMRQGGWQAQHPREQKAARNSGFRDTEFNHARIQYGARTDRRACTGEDLWGSSLLETDTYPRAHAYKHECKHVCGHARSHTHTNEYKELKADHWLEKRTLLNRWTDFVGQLISLDRWCNWTSNVVKHFLSLISSWSLWTADLSEPLISMNSWSSWIVKPIQQLMLGSLFRTRWSVSFDEQVVLLSRWSPWTPGLFEQFSLTDQWMSLNSWYR